MVVTQSLLGAHQRVVVTCLDPLPLEVREQIYEFAMSEEVAYAASLSNYIRFEGWASQPLFPLPALVRTSAAFYQEAGRVFLRIASIILHSNFDVFKRFVADIEGSASVRSVVIRGLPCEYDFRDNTVYTYMDLSYFHNLPAVRNVELLLDSGSIPFLNCINGQPNNNSEQTLVPKDKRHQQLEELFAVPYIAGIPGLERFTIVLIKYTGRRKTERIRRCCLYIGKKVQQCVRERDQNPREISYTVTVRECHEIKSAAEGEMLN